MSTPSDAVVIEEIEIEKPSSTTWIVLGAIAVAVLVVFGVRRARRPRPNV